MTAKFFRETATKKIGVKGGYPIENSSVFGLFTAYGQICYFLDFFPSFLYFFPPIFLPPLNFRGTSNSLKILRGTRPQSPSLPQPGLF